MTNICDLKPNMKNFNLTAIVLDVSPPTLTKDQNELRIVKVADKTGSVDVCVYNEIGALLQPSYICQFTRCYSNPHKSCLTVYTGRSGKVVKVGEFGMLFNELPNMSEPMTNEQMDQFYQGISGQSKPNAPPYSSSDGDPSRNNN